MISDAVHKNLLVPEDYYGNDKPQRILMFGEKKHGAEKKSNQNLLNTIKHIGGRHVLTTFASNDFTIMDHCEVDDDHIYLPVVCQDTNEKIKLKKREGYIPFIMELIVWTECYNGCPLKLHPEYTYIWIKDESRILVEETGAYIDCTIITR